VGAAGLKLVREALLGAGAPLHAALRELTAQQLGACGSPACGAACPLRRTLRCAPPVYALALDWDGSGERTAPGDIGAALDALQGPLDVGASFDATDAQAAAQPAPMHSLRALVLASCVPSKPGACFALPPGAASGWVQTAGGAAAAAAAVSWAALKAKCIKEGLAPQLALYTRD